MPSCGLQECPPRPVTSSESALKTLKRIMGHSCPLMLRRKLMGVTDAAAVVTLISECEHLQETHACHSK